MRDSQQNKIPSKKHQRIKDVKAFIREKAALLPVTYEEYASTESVLGAVILADPTLSAGLSEKQVENIKPENTYPVLVANRRIVDHYKRMFKAAKNGGAQAVLNYFNQVCELSADMVTPTIGGINIERDYGNPFQNY